MGFAKLNRIYPRAVSGSPVLSSALTLNPVWLQRARSVIAKTGATLTLQAVSQVLERELQLSSKLRDGEAILELVEKLGHSIGPVD